jgi:hypothetical protein
MSPLVDKLERLPPGHITRYSPGTPEIVARVEAAFGLRFPDDFREVMLWSNGFGMSYHKTNMNVSPLEELESDNREEQYTESIPGMFVLGTDGGGGIYFFDPQGKLGQGPFAVFLVRQSQLGFRDAMLCGRSFTEALEAALANQDFYDRPSLGETSGWSEPAS